LADPREKKAIDDAIRRDIVVVAGVGNVPQASLVQYPARYPGVLAVAATGRTGGHAAVSTVGAEVMISAPGEDISTAWLNHEYAVSTGTSDSTAIVSGVAALVRSKFPNMKAADVIHQIVATAVDAGPLGRDDQFGYGIVNPLAALSTDLADVSPSASPLASLQGQRGESARAPRGSWNRSAVLLAGVILIVLLAAGGVATALIVSRR